MIYIGRPQGIYSMPQRNNSLKKDKERSVTSKISLFEKIFVTQKIGFSSSKMIYVHYLGGNIPYIHINTCHFRGNISEERCVTSWEIFVTSWEIFRENICYFRGTMCHLRGNIRKLRAMIPRLRRQILFLRGKIRYLKSKIRYTRGKIRYLKGKIH